MKKIILMLSIILLTGCSAKYNLDYRNNIFSESVVIKSTDETEMNGDTPINESYNNYFNSVNLAFNYNLDYGDYEVPIEKCYTKNLINNGIKLSYEFKDNKSYKYSSIVHNLFENFYVSDYFVKAYKIKDIFDNYKLLDDIEISFSTDKIVTKNNADKVINDVYYWNINKNDYKDKVIDIEFKNTVVKDESLVKDGYLTEEFFKYVFLIILVIFLSSILIIYEKIKKSNN